LQDADSDCSHQRKIHIDLGAVDSIAGGALQPSASA